MAKINLNGRLNFDSIDLTEPYIVVENIVKEIKEQTNGYINGIIKDYNGPISSYETATHLSGLNYLLNNNVATKTVDIQNSLGKLGEKISQYEFYLTTPILEKYKYRVCFFKYGIANYPVDIVLEQSIANEINKTKGYGGSNYNYTCNNREELEDLITKIIYSKRVIKIMQELINIYQIHMEDSKRLESSNPSIDDKP